jgi:pilus assembly protein CpaC
MANRTTICTAILSVALFALVDLASVGQAVAAEAATQTPIIRVAASEATSRFVPLGIGKSVAIDLPG